MPRSWSTIALLALGCATLSCSAGSPAAPEAVDSQPLLRIVSDPVVTMDAGTTVALAIEERRAGGAWTPAAAAAFSWKTDRPSLLTADAGMLRAHEGYGQAVVTATSSTGVSASVRVWVQPRPDATPTFRITLIFADGVPSIWRREFRAAANRWMENIRTSLPVAVLNNTPHACGTPPGRPPLPALNGTESGTRVYVGLGNFPAGTYTEAVGGPCLQRPLPYPTTIFGAISVNPDKFDELEDPLRRQYVALHELGHTLGLVGVVQGVQPDWFDVPDTYRGPLGLEGYRRQFRVATSSVGVPGAHWPFPEDIMGDRAGNLTIGLATRGALMDLGYPVRW